MFVYANFGKKLEIKSFLELGGNTCGRGRWGGMDQGGEVMVLEITSRLKTSEIVEKT
jgi:hypothetical protein